MKQAHQNFRRHVPKNQNRKGCANFRSSISSMQGHCQPNNFPFRLPKGNMFIFNNQPIPIRKNVRMTNSPETKINFDNVEQPKQNYLPPNLKTINQRGSFETLQTASTSTESLLSNKSTKSGGIIKSTVRSQENLLNPFNMMYGMGGLNGLNICNNFNSFHRGVSMNNLINNEFNEQRNSIKKPAKCYYNKFNSEVENSNNENTVILALKVKVGEDDYRVFNIKKFDDLFISLQKFLDLNQIKQELIKPIITKIFSALNKIYWVLNNNVSEYDQEYLLSIYRLWLKRKEKFKQNQNVEKEKVHNNKKERAKENSSFSEGLSREVKVNSMNISF